MIWCGFVLDMLRILVCISGRKSGWFVSEGGREGVWRGGEDTQTVL